MLKSWKSDLIIIYFDISYQLNIYFHSQQLHTIYINSNYLFWIPDLKYYYERCYYYVLKEGLMYAKKLMSNLARANQFSKISDIYKVLFYNDQEI